MRRAAGVLAAFVVAAAAVVGLLAFLSSRDSAPVSRTVRGPGREFPDQGSARLAPGRRPPRLYDSDPPTSGSHYNIAGVAPAPTGVHSQPIQNEVQVHNLEHGHIGIQWNNLPNAIVSALEQFTNARDTYVFMAPRPTMQTGVQLAFSRWDQLITCASPTDTSAVVKLATTFYNDYHGDGPEGALPGTPLSQ